MIGDSNKKFGGAGGGLQIARGSFRLSSATSSPTIDYNLDFLPSIVIVNMVRANNEVPQTSGNDGAILTRNNGLYNLQGYFSSSTHCELLVNRNGSVEFIAKNFSANPQITQEYVKLPYFYSSSLWRANVDYEWIAIG